MEKLNIPPFTVGDKVVYITGETMPKGSIHIIDKLMKSDCGCFLIGIGQTNLNAVNRCVRCNVPLFIYNNTRWYYASSFRLIQEQKFRAVSFEKIMEDVELICEN